MGAAVRLRDDVDAEALCRLAKVVRSRSNAPAFILGQFWGQYTKLLPFDLAPRAPRQARQRVDLVARRHARIGRLLGGAGFVRILALHFGRPLAPRKPGRRPEKGRERPGDK
jgi:hypothetical protein